MLFSGYLYYLLFSPYPPGEPAINPDTSALIEILHESLNLFYLNIWLDSLQLSPIPSIPEHPISESIFNIIMGWGMMLGPAILADARSEKVPQRYESHVPSQQAVCVLMVKACAETCQHRCNFIVACRYFQWALIVSIWTFALMPYMAQRASQEPLPASENAPTSSSQLAESDTPGWQKGVGTLGILVGAFSLGWWALGRPEYGDLAERVAFFSTRLANQRVFGGFLVDLGIYWLAQWLFMRGAGAPKSYSAVPYFGVGAWLVAGRPRE